VNPFNKRNLNFGTQVKRKAISLGFYFPQADYPLCNNQYLLHRKAKNEIMTSVYWSSLMKIVRLGVWVLKFNAALVAVIGVLL
jgi:hypothetical protein